MDIFVHWDSPITVQPGLAQPKRAHSPEKFGRAV